MKIISFVGVLLISLLAASCSLFKKADKDQENRHPGNYLTAKTKIVGQFGDSVRVEFVIKNKARKTAYENIDMIFQIERKDGKPGCSFGEHYLIKPIKPGRKRKIKTALYCPKADAKKISFINLTAVMPGK